jgi:hypothetical protein
MLTFWLASMGGGAVVVSRLAGPRGRNVTLWTLASLLASLLALVPASWLFGQALESDMGGYELLFMFLSAVTPALGAAVVGAWLWWLPPSTRLGKATSWAMVWLDDGRRDANRGCMVTLSGEYVDVIPDPDSVTPRRHIARAQLLASGDGEVVRLVWRDGERDEAMTLRPTELPGDRTAKVANAEAIAARLSGSHLPRARTRARRPPR